MDEQQFIEISYNDEVIYKKVYAADVDIFHMPVDETLHSFEDKATHGMSAFRNLHGRIKYIARFTYEKRDYYVGVLFDPKLTFVFIHFKFARGSIIAPPGNTIAYIYQGRTMSSLLEHFNKEYLR